MVKYVVQHEASSPNPGSTHKPSSETFCPLSTSEPKDAITVTFNTFLSLGVSHTSSNINKSPRVPGEHWGLPPIPLDDHFFPLAIEPTAES